MKTYIKLAALLLFGSACAWRLFNFTARRTSSQDFEVIKIGVLEPLSGAAEDGGRLELEGAKNLLTMFPEVLGRKVQLVIADNESDREKSKGGWQTDW